MAAGAWFAFADEELERKEDDNGELVVETLENELVCGLLDELLLTEFDELEKFGILVLLTLLEEC